MNQLYHFKIKSKIIFLLLSSIITISRADSLEIDIDRFGMDYRRVELTAADPILCQSECMGDAGCKSFTYVKPGLHAPGAVCYLKNGEPNPTPNNCCISGLRLVNNQDISAIHIEFEQPVSGTLPPKTSRTTTRISSDGSVIGVSEGSLAGVPDRMWDPGQTLKVKMTGGSAIVRSKVRQFAEEWTKYANINFQFVDDSSPAEIRISFDKRKGSWSTVGRDALLVPFNFPTMNFHDLSDSSTDADYGYYVLHEFGHALGLIHEHQSPTAGIPWNKEKVYKYFKESQDPPWDKAKVDSNIFERYSASSTNYSQYDQNSIMHYYYDPSLTLNNQGSPVNRVLSATDKQYIAKWYPNPSADIGQLRTNDDCDEIEFQVEYRVEDTDKVRFILNPGTNVTWWKLIAIPIEANKYAELQINRGWLDSNLPSDRLIDKVSLDSSRPIRFHKAKFAGVHTLLGYTWDVISALPGGSRVTLNWNKDHCK